VIYLGESAAESSGIILYMKPVTAKYYDIILAIFVASLLISNIAATKLISIGPMIADGGAILFPLAYIIGDLLTEVYGFKYARRAIWVGFGVMILAIASFFIVGLLPAAPEYTSQDSYNAVLGFLPRIALASLSAYLIGSFINAYVLAKLKAHLKRGSLWSRLIGSTIVGQLIDTIVFGLIAFGGIITAKDMITFILVGWLFKTGSEVILLPLIYASISWVKKHEQIKDINDPSDFSPFRIKL